MTDSKSSEIKGYIDSIYAGSGVDGKGLRVVVFFSGCNLRCGFCHNPETLFVKGKEYFVKTLLKRILRYKDYIVNGGVTLSGGEPFLQAEFCAALSKTLKNNGINTAVETNGTLIHGDLINNVEYFICDVKNQTADDLSCYRDFLSALAISGKKAELTNVIINGVNDGRNKLAGIKSLLIDYSETVIGVRFLPFMKLCEKKYRELNIKFAYSEKKETSEKEIQAVYALFNKI